MSVIYTFCVIFYFHGHIVIYCKFNCDPKLKSISSDWNRIPVVPVVMLQRKTDMAFHAHSSQLDHASITQGPQGTTWYIN